MPTTTQPTLVGINLYPVKSCHSISVSECKVNKFGLELDRRFMFVDSVTGRFISQRKYASMTLIRPIVDVASQTLTLTVADDSGLEPLVLPLYPDVSKLAQRTVQLWKDTLTVYDMGDAASEWIARFFAAHRAHDLANDHNPEESVANDQQQQSIRLVTLDDGGVYRRPAHPELPGVHSPFSDWSPVSLGFESSLEDVNKGLLETGISNGQSIPMDRFRNNLTIAGTVPWDEDEWLVIKIGEVTFYAIRPIARCTVPSVNQDTGIKDSWGRSGVLEYLKIKRSFPHKPNDGCFCVDAAPLNSGIIRVGDPVQVLERVPAHLREYPRTLQ